MSKSRIALAALATTALLGGNIALASSASADRDRTPRPVQERCEDRVLRTFYEKENVADAPGTRGRQVVSVRVLKKVVVDREYDRRSRRCETRGFDVEAVYVDTPRDRSHRQHL